MSFQLQYGAIAQELKKAGLSGDAAVRIAKILANSAQPMRSGPVEVDTTPRGIRNVTPNRRKFQLTNLDFVEGNPDHRRRRTGPSESRSRPAPASAIQTAAAPQASENPFNVSPGTYTETRSGANGVEVGLRIAGTGAFITQDPSSGTLVGKSIRAEADAGENGLVRFFVEEQAGEYVFRLQVNTASLQDFIYQSLGLDPPSAGGGGGGEDGFPRPTPAQRAFVDVALTGDGLCFKRAGGDEVCVGVVACDQQG